MARDPRGTTTQRGLGWAHQKERQRLLPLALYTQCPLCGVTMYPDERLDLDHVIPRSLGGGTEGNGQIVHSKCNQAEGPRISAARRQRRRGYSDDIRSRRW